MRKKSVPTSVAVVAEDLFVISNCRLIAGLLDLRARIEARLRQEEVGDPPRISAAPIATS
jgi:hypothetical protein